MTYLIAAITMTFSVLEGHFLLQAFSSAIFHICGTLHSPSVSPELLEGLKFHKNQLIVIRLL